MKKNPALLPCIFLFLAASCTPETDVGTGPTWTPDYSDTPALAVEALEVTTGSLVQTVTSSGIVSGINEAYVVSETQGIIQDVSFELGQTVDKGQVLLKLDDSIAKLDMEEAFEQYNKALLALESAEKLYEKGGISKADLLNARGNVKRSLSAFENAKKAYADRTILAPLTGSIAQRDVLITKGNLLKHNQQVTRIIGTDGFQVKIGVGEGEIVLLQKGYPADVRVRAACGERDIPGEVRAIAAGSDTTTGSYEVIVTILENCSNAIRTGMSAEVAIPIPVTESSIVIPNFSVIRRNGEVYVFTEQDGVAVPRRVSTGESRVGRIMVKEGLSEGETLIVSGLSRLKPGDRVLATVVGKSSVWQ